MKHAEMDSSGSFPLHLTAYVFLNVFIFLEVWLCRPLWRCRGCDCSLIRPYAWITKPTLSPLHVVYQGAVSQTQPRRGPGPSLRTHALICQTRSHRKHIQHCAAHDGVILLAMASRWEPDFGICIHGCTFWMRSRMHAHVCWLEM